jgi:hypothetical protein
VSGGHLKAGGLSPLSFAYFSLRRQRKVGAAPHRGDANRPITKQGKANAAGKQHEKANAVGKQPNRTTNKPKAKTSRRRQTPKGRRHKQTTHNRAAGKKEPLPQTLRANRTPNPMKKPQPHHKQR